MVIALYIVDCFLGLSPQHFFNLQLNLTDENDKKTAQVISPVLLSDLNLIIRNVSLQLLMMAFH